MNNRNIDLSKHVWEGWTVGDFIDELSMDVKRIMENQSIQKPFKNKKELSDWCKSNQPYYKKTISQVNNYFAQMYGLKE